jgi:hypothetical protein
MPRTSMLVLQQKKSRRRLAVREHARYLDVQNTEEIVISRIFLEEAKSTYQFM